jgi:hypothetical protein
MKYWIVLLVLLSGCGKGVGTVDPVFQGYVDDFIKLTGAEKRPGWVHFDDLDLMGLCAYQTGEIRIDRERWEKASSLLRRELLYHELSHCLFGLPHSPSPASYMHSPMPPFYALEDLEAEVLVTVRKQRASYRRTLRCLCCPFLLHEMCRYMCLQWEQRRAREG